MKRIIIRKGREKSLQLRHLWVFSGSIERAEDGIAAGDVVRVEDCGGSFLAFASYNPASKIAARIWSFDENQEIGEQFFREKIKCAIKLRRELGLWQPKGGCRVIHSEGDFLPGVIADRYGEFIIVQILSAGAEKFKQLIADILLEESGCAGIYERSDVAVREKEGLAGSTGLLAGSMPPEELVIEENGCRFLVDVFGGHKSGFYLDQRESRRIISGLAPGRTVLNCFSYTGGFGVGAACNGAQFVTNVDSSAPALKIAADNMALNRIPAEKYENIEGDCFSLLRKFRAEKRKFDLIILDPPKLVDSQKALFRGAKAYKDMALVALQILNPGGFLVNFSCSGLVDPALFQKITFDAACDAGVELQLLSHLEQSSDHPTNLAVPEGFYLKGLLLRRDLRKEE